MAENTSIGFGGGEVIQVALPLNEVRYMVQKALGKPALIEFEASDGDCVIINPLQVKVLQPVEGLRDG